MEAKFKFEAASSNVIIKKERSIDIIELYKFHKKYWAQPNAIEQRKFLQRRISISNVQRIVVDEEERKIKSCNYIIYCHIQTRT